ncbi:hypothetical protein V502_00676, partial [Pseudogymnoascus sp. VKM F-4520 (FW-2644)]
VNGFQYLGISYIENLTIRGERVTAFGYSRYPDESDYDSDYGSDGPQAGAPFEREISTWTVTDSEELQDAASTNVTYCDNHEGIVKFSQSIEGNQTIVQDICWELLLKNGQWEGYLRSVEDFRKYRQYYVEAFSAYIRIDSQCRFIAIAEWPDYETDLSASIPLTPTIHIYTGSTYSKIKSLHLDYKLGAFRDFTIECRTIILFFDLGIKTIQFKFSDKKHENSLLVLEALLREKSSCGEIAMYQDIQQDQQNAFRRIKSAGRHQYLANIALKVNCKLLGVNQSLDVSKLGIIGEGKTMVVGIDVTHPSPGSLSNAPDQREKGVPKYPSMSSARDTTRASTQLKKAKPTVPQIL